MSTNIQDIYHKIYLIFIIWSIYIIAFKIYHLNQRNRNNHSEKLIQKNGHF